MVDWEYCFFFPFNSFFSFFLVLSFCCGNYLLQNLILYIKGMEWIRYARVGIFYCYIVIGPIDKYDCLIYIQPNGDQPQNRYLLFQYIQGKKQDFTKIYHYTKKKNWVILFPRVRRWQMGSDVRRRENDNIDEIRYRDVAETGT